METLKNNPEYLVFGMMALLILLIVMFIMVTYLTSKYSKLERRFRVFLEGESGRSLEKVMYENLKETKQIRLKSQKVQDQIDAIQANQNECYRKIGIYRYDAFRDIGGKLSFTLTLLDDNNSGFLISCMHGSDGCYTYLKEIVHGEPFVAISDEEQISLDSALKCEKYQ